MRVGLGLGLYGFGGGAARFNPPGSPVLWIDPSRPTSVTSSSNIASAIADQTSNGNNMSCFGSLGYGLTTQNGLNTLHQSGASFLNVTLAGGGLNDFTIIKVIKLLTGAATGYNAQDTFGPFSPAHYHHAGALDWFAATDHAFTDLTGSAGDVVVIAWVRSGTNALAYKNNVASSLNPLTVSGANTGASFALLSEQFASSSSPGQYDLAETFIAPSALSTTDLTTYYNYLKPKWATP